MFWIGANALPLLANIKAREDGNLTLPAFHSASQSTLSSLDNSCGVLKILEETFKVRHLIEQYVEQEQGQRTILKHEKRFLQERRPCKKG